MIFRLISRNGEAPSSDRVGRSAGDVQAPETARSDVSPALRSRLDQLEEMREIIKGYAGSAPSEPASGGQVRRLGNLEALVARLEQDARKTVELEAELQSLKAVNRNVTAQLAKADEEIRTKAALAETLREQLDMTRAGLKTATSDIENQMQVIAAFEPKMNHGKNRLEKAQRAIAELQRALETSEAERIIDARNLRQLEDELSSAENRVAAAGRKADALEAKLERASLLRDEQALEIRDLKVQLKAAKSENARVESRHKLECEDLNAAIRRHEKSLLSRQKRIVSLEGRIEKQAEKLETQSARIEALKVARKKLEEDARERKRKPVSGGRSAKPATSRVRKSRARKQTA